MLLASSTFIYVVANALGIVFAICFVVAVIHGVLKA